MRSLVCQPRGASKMDSNLLYLLLVVPHCASASCSARKPIGIFFFPQLFASSFLNLVSGVLEFSVLRASVAECGNRYKGRNAIEGKDGKEREVARCRQEGLQP